MTRAPVAPVSPLACLGGAQPGSPPGALPPPPPPSAGSYVRQIYRSSPHAAQACEAQPLPTSAGVSEPSLRAFQRRYWGLLGNHLKTVTGVVNPHLAQVRLTYGRGRGRLLQLSETAPK